MISKFNATVTKKRQQKAWADILEEINLSCPNDKQKNGAEMKKKWNNLKTAAKLDIAQHKKSLTETGKNCCCVLASIVSSYFIKF